MEQIVAGVFELDPADRETWLASREAGVRRSRAEPGCITYVLVADPLEPGVVQLFERWESEAALAEHRKAMAEAPGADPGVVLLRAELHFYEATEISG